MGGSIYFVMKAMDTEHCDRDRRCKKDALKGAAWQGGGIMLGSIVVGAVLMSFDDDVDVKVAPQQQALRLKLPRARTLSLRGQF